MKIRRKQLLIYHTYNYQPLPFSSRKSQASENKVRSRPDISLGRVTIIILKLFKTTKITCYKGGKINY